MNLYEITKKIDEVLNKIPEDPTPEQVEQLQQEYLKLDGDFTDKIENTVKFIKNLEGELNALDFEIDRLSKKKKPISNKVKRLKEYIDFAMTAGGYEKLTTSIAKISYRKSVSVLIVNEDDISDEFKTEVTTTKISKADIKKALKDGEVEGATLVEKKSLQIK